MYIFSTYIESVYILYVYMFIQGTIFLWFFFARFLFYYFCVRSVFIVGVLGIHGDVNHPGTTCPTIPSGFGGKDGLQ